MNNNENEKDETLTGIHPYRQSLNAFCNSLKMISFIRSIFNSSIFLPFPNSFNSNNTKY